MSEPRKTCHECHKQVPISQMNSKNIRINTGKSGMSMTVGAGGKNPRFNSGRQYYRNKEVWICHTCRPLASPAKMVFQFLATIAGMALLIYFYSLAG